MCVLHRLTGTGDSSFIYCSQPTAATATPFSMPLTHFYSLRLTSKLSAKACGANFLPKGLADRCEGALIAGASFFNCMRTFVQCGHADPLTPR